MHVALATVCTAGLATVVLAPAATTIAPATLAASPPATLAPAVLALAALTPRPTELAGALVKLPLQPPAPPGTFNAAGLQRRRSSGTPIFRLAGLQRRYSAAGLRRRRPRCVAGVAAAGLAPTPSYVFPARELPLSGSNRLDLSLPSLGE